jgi:uncharacterized damage-inducible protein DinB
MEIANLQTFLEYFDSVHKRTRRVVLCIPPADIEWSPAPGRFTCGQIVRHLAGIERWMYAETVRGRPTAYPGHDRGLAEGFDSTLTYYDRLHDESREIFASLSTEDLAGKSMTPAGTSITTWKWLRAMIEHEAHHRGQLYMMLGLRGVTTPPIYGLTSEEVLSRSVRAE